MNATFDLRPMPLPVDSFVGRNVELTRLNHLLQRHRLVSLAGPPGAGKTRLAIELAHRTFAAQSRRAWLLEVRRPAAGEPVPGFAQEHLQPIMELLGRPVAAKMKLLVLDGSDANIEASTVLAEQLRCGYPELAILATSLEPLHTLHGKTYRIAGLPETDATRLLIERARAVYAQFQVTDDSLRLIAEICVRLDGLPLAMELAARRAALVPLAEMHSLLDRRFELLSDAVRTADPRHRSLETAIAWSYQRLEPAEQAVFRRLAVAPGGLPRHGVAAICGWDGVHPADVPELVRQLEQKSVVMPEPDTGRVHQLESIRLFARQRLVAAGEHDLAFGKLVEWLSEIADTGDAAERENFAHAAAWAEAGGDDRYAVFTAAFAEGLRVADQTTDDLARLERALPGPGHTGQAPNSPALTRRQRAVGRMLMEGLTNREIAGRLNVALRTVEAEVTSFRRRSGAQTRAELAVWLWDHRDQLAAGA